MWSTLPRFAKIASYIGAIAGAIIAVITLWTMLDLPTSWVPATRSYVNEREAKANEARSEIIFAVIDLASDHKERIKRGRDALVSRLAAATDPQVKVDLQSLIDVADQDIADVVSRIVALERMRAR